VGGFHFTVSTANDFTCGHRPKISQCAAAHYFTQTSMQAEDADIEKARESVLFSTKSALTGG